VINDLVNLRRLRYWMVSPAWGLLFPAANGGNLALEMDASASNFLEIGSYRQGKEGRKNATIANMWAMSTPYPLPRHIAHHLHHK
jgi:hypothetical protein